MKTLQSKPPFFSLPSLYHSTHLLRHWFPLSEEKFFSPRQGEPAEGPTSCLPGSYQVILLHLYLTPSSNSHPSFPQVIKPAHCCIPRAKHSTWHNRRIKEWTLKSPLLEKGFPGGSAVKNPPANARDVGREDPLKKEMATHFSSQAWKIPWTEEPGRLQYMGSQESD